METAKMSCAVCMEQLQQSRQPKVLGCGHSFCLACIEHWFESKQRCSSKDRPDRHAVRCPVCVQYTRPPVTSEGGVDLASLPTNFTLVEAVEENSKRLCDEDEDEGSASWQCRLHAGRTLEFRCKTCDGQPLICRQCAKSQHRPEAGHRIGSLASLVQQQSIKATELEHMVMELQMRNIELTESNANLQLDLLDRESMTTNSVTTTEQDSKVQTSGIGDASASETGSGAVFKAREESGQEYCPAYAAIIKRKPLPAPPVLITKTLPSAGLVRNHKASPPPPPHGIRDSYQPHALLRFASPPPQPSVNRHSSGKELPTSSSVQKHPPPPLPSSRNRQPLARSQASSPPPHPSSDNHLFTGQASATSSSTEEHYSQLDPSVPPRRHKLPGVKSIDAPSSSRPQLPVLPTAFGPSDTSMSGSSSQQTNQKPLSHRLRGTPPPPPPRPRTRPALHPNSRRTPACDEKS